MAGQKKIPLYNMAVNFYRNKKFQQATEILQKILSRDPGNSDAWHLQGVIYRSQKQIDKSVAALETAISIAPDNPFFLNSLGNALKDADRYGEAVEKFEKAVLLKPDYFQAHSNMAIAMKKMERFSEAARHARKAIALNVEYAQAYEELAGALVEMNQVDEAIENFLKSLLIKPDNAYACSNLGVCYSRLGLFDKARRYLNRALTLNPDYTHVYERLANITRVKPEDPLFGAISSAIEKETSAGKLRFCYFAMGKMHADIGEFDDAFEYYRLGNEMRKKNCKERFDPQVHSAHITRVIQAYDKKFFTVRSDFGISDETPVFIVGMPRSGTTLVEQIISSHPEVYGAGELTKMDALACELKEGVGADIKMITAAYLDRNSSVEMARKYLSCIRELAGDSASRVTDKMPFNYFFLPLITLLFPKARIIHCTRNPLDTCISAFFQDFSKDLPFADDLEYLKEYYEQYTRLMEHWKSVLPVKVFEIAYENLVEDQAHWSRELLSFCGLKWDESCLEFYKHDRPVLTASIWQVRQKIYKSSKGKWHRYRKHLSPLMPLLSL